MVSDQLPNDMFSTLILHVSNDCNMQCAYCFANHGTYASARSLMSVETAIRTVEVFYSRYRVIKEVKFFGGEPFMNIPAIEAICSRIHEKYAAHEIAALPRFKVITNGTILNRRIIELVNKYQIRVVFSMDGPAAVHDTLRFFSGRKPSHSLILNNFHILQRETSGEQPCSIETTYTQAHLDVGIGIIDVVDYFCNELALKNMQVNVSLVNLPMTNLLHIDDIARCWSEYARNFVEKAKRSENCSCDLKLQGLIYRLKQKKTASEELCSAGGSWLAVSSSGNVYPCLMFMDQDGFYMGNVWDDLFQSNRFLFIADRFRSCRPIQKDPCSECFANRICSKCAGINYYQTKRIDGCYPMQCDAVKQTIHTLICAIADGVL